MNISPREASPSPSFRERQRAIKGQSVPLVYSHQQQPSPTASNSSHQSKRSPPPNSRISPTHVIPGVRDLAQERPVPVHTLSQPDVRQGISPPAPPPPPQHSLSQPEIPTQYNGNPVIGYPRPINRVAPPQFLSNFQQMESSWQMTDELLAEIERADLQQTQAAAGTYGVAYAGGAASGAVSYSHNVEVGSPPKDLTLERIRSSERTSPKDSDGSQGTATSLGRRQTLKDRTRDAAQGLRDSPTGRGPLPAVPASTSPNSQPSRRNRSPDTGDHYATPVGSPGEHTAAYNGYEREYYPAPARMPTPPAMRRSSNATAPESGTLRGTPPAVAKLAGQTPPAQAAKARTPDRSLPVQEEPEEDVTVGTSKTPRDRRSTEYSRRETELVNDRRPSPTPSSDVHPEGNNIRYGPRDDRHDDGRASRAEHREDDDVTLNEHDEDDHDQHKDNSLPSESESYTPRSPTADLPNHYGADIRYATANVDFQQTIRAKTRNGVTDQLGLRGLEQTFETMRDQPPQQPTRQGPLARQPQLPAYSADLQNFFDESAYLQAYLQSPRPGAPIPPTPHSQTAAPSPSPLISGIHSELGTSPAPPVGSPYPYPFTHIRRTNGYNASQQSSSYDPNHPAAIQEQLARQMQIYAMNNAAILSDSTLSPSSTPFPGPGYNPWAFLPTTRHMRNGLDASMSMRSSPSHEPLELVPPRVTRGKSLKHTNRSGNLRAQPQVAAKQRKPPPRVESTQPRETSPENTSGEETAGEEKIEEQFVADEAHWVNGVSRDDTGEWVDEDEDDDGDDDLLELEFHPSYIGNPEKRRRKWETRWDELVQAFQALDRQTDTTLVLLASPPHSTKLHALTSRSLKRDPSLRHSPAMSSIRTSFTHIASQRRASRSQMTSIADRLALHSSASADGSDVSSSSREEDLKRALEAALGSLGALGNIYEQREARWREEMRRITDERERVELLLRQTLGSRLPNGDGVGHAL
ncbi:hypothetical protein NEOLEDRAFT_1069823 [Neolentinus lepideus HHB14362 ss-1]|uniref:Uncharacterized protein n=1 Tax=Neolentinus lepideus HHB14362 ss-1 TaxID=1314782 RepID=A0A165R222_9AGAM|nr:hypothetical protein NEOLEDRAFT_1069823 [Neolentinus lepideus HHB14362 ss-1]